MKLAIDMSSWLWAALLAGKDEEGGRSVPHPTKEDRTLWVNSADWGYENIVNTWVSTMSAYRLAPIDCIPVFEMAHSKRIRLAIDPDYKPGSADKAPESRVEFEKLRDRMRKLMLDLGACVVGQEFVESDDVLAWLARETEEDMLVATRDRDLIVLNQTNKYGAKVQVLCGDRAPGENLYGPWDLKLIPTFKALVGDSGDGIKGCVGFGEKAWIDFLVKYGEDGALELQDLLELGSLGPLHAQTDCKLVKKICDQEAQVLKSYRCGRLYPEQVNTLRHPLIFSPGMVVQRPERADERLAKYYGESYLIDADAYEEAMAYADAHLQASPEFFLDIETATPPESDDWLAAQGDPDGVDVIGSKLVSMGFTFGRNNQITYYFTHNHKGAKNLTSEQICDFVISAARFGKPIVVQNFGGFEGPILFKEWGEAMALAFPKFRGFLPNVLDTALSASYVDENQKRGLKQRSKLHLGYEQTSYKETTTKQGPVGTLPAGGRQKRVFEQVVRAAVLDETGKELEPALVETWEERQYKMNELTAEEVFSYGTDDTICTAGLHNFYKLHMQLEHHWDVYVEVELRAMYLHAKNFVDGICISVETSNMLAKIDDETSDKAWAVLRDWLIKVGFDGTVCPELDGSEPLTLADIKEVFAICAPRTELDVDEDGAPTPRKLRKNGRAVGNMSLPKVLIHIREVEEQATLAMLLEPLVKEGFTPDDVNRLNTYLKSKFDGEPDNPVGSPRKMQRILYEIMGLPIKVRNNATDVMRAKGIYDGTPKTDSLAIEYALRSATEEQKDALEAIKLIQMVKTRHALFYDKYPGFVHWKTGRVHSQHNQCEAVTRRSSSSKPNTQQVAKLTKVEGQPPRYREVYVPHRRDAVIVSCDFSSQELTHIADGSGDANLIACFVPPEGGSKRSQHSITGLAIFQKKRPEYSKVTYDEFVQILEDKSDPRQAEVKAARALGKKLNFTSEFMAMAKKVQLTLLLDTEEEAQAYLDAREAQFPEVTRWRRQIIQDAKRLGYSLTRMGARRHLRDAFMSADPWEVMKAERQAYNYRVQSSSGEQTRLAEGAIWDAGLLYKFDAQMVSVIHDEIVISVRIQDLEEFIPAMHACMVQPYGGIKAVPIESSISFGPDFGRQCEIGSEPTKEAIQKGLAEMQSMVKLAA